MTNVVGTYNSSGELIYEASFETAEKAYEEYKDIIENLKKKLPKGYEIRVVRFRDQRIMTQEIVIGMH